MVFEVFLLVFSLICIFVLGVCAYALFLLVSPWTLAMSIPVLILVICEWCEMCQETIDLW